MGISSIYMERRTPPNCVTTAGPTDNYSPTDENVLTITGGLLHSSQRQPIVGFVSSRDPNFQQEPDESIAVKKLISNGACQR